MKRLYIAFAIAVFLVAACVSSVLYQRRETTALMASIDRLVENFHPERPADSLAATNAFLEEYDRRTKVFPLFSRHNTLTDVECELVSLPAILEKGEPLDYAATLLRCRERLYAYYRLELPLPENIL